MAACGDDPEVFFVGGAELYAQVLPRVERLYITEIQAEYEGDAWFPTYDASQWKETARERRTSPEGLAFDFVTYQR